MSLFNSYDRTKFLGELNSPLETQGQGVLTPAQQKALVMANISGAGVGYSAGQGSGGAVTQLTSRTTGVTLNTLSGAVTLFAAAGSATAASFTVTDSQVGVNDTIVLNQKSGTNLYVLAVTTVAAGSFVVTFFTTGGTTSDSPVISFSVIKGAVT